MIYLTAETKILLAIEPVNFRKQIDGLVALCEEQLNEDPRSAKLFVFINRARTMIRALQYQDNGYWLATKRLSRGRYPYWPKEDGVVRSLVSSELMRILKAELAYAS